MSDAATYAKRQEDWRMALGFIQTGNGKKKRPIPGRTYAVALAIQTFENRDTGLAWPSRETVGRKAGMFGAPATVERETSKHLKTLTQAGVLEESGHDRSGAVRYRFTIPADIAGRMTLGNSPQGSDATPVEQSTPLGNSPQGVELSTGLPLGNVPQGGDVEQSTGSPWGTVHRGTSEGTSERTFDYEPPIINPSFSSETHAHEDEMKNDFDPETVEDSASADTTTVAALPALEEEDASPEEPSPSMPSADASGMDAARDVMRRESARRKYGTEDNPTAAFYAALEEFTGQPDGQSQWADFAPEIRSHVWSTVTGEPEPVADTPEETPAIEEKTPEKKVTGWRARPGMPKNLASASV